MTASFSGWTVRLYEALFPNIKSKRLGGRRRGEKQQGWGCLQDRSGTKKLMRLGNVVAFLQPYLSKDLLAGISPLQECSPGYRLIQSGSSGVCSMDRGARVRQQEAHFCF